MYSVINYGAVRRPPLGRNLATLCLYVPVDRVVDYRYILPGQPALSGHARAGFARSRFSGLVSRPPVIFFIFLMGEPA